jgi:hypothetical protein
VAEITNMEVKANKKKNDQETGHNLYSEYTVKHGDLKGRKFFENLNLWHKLSTQAVEIAQKQLSSIGHAVGVTAGKDLTLLAFKPMLVEVALDPAEPDVPNPNTGDMIKGHGPSNRIIQRKLLNQESFALYIEGQPAGGAVPGAAAPQQAQQVAAANAAPTFNPASAAPITAGQAAPAFTPAAAAPAAAPTGAAAPVNGAAPAAAGGAPATPPWLK